MKIWKSVLEARKEITKTKSGSVVTIGNFDGVHRGHQAIMRRTMQLAGENRRMAVAVTFTNHTESLLEERPLLLNTPSIRRELLLKQGLDALLEVEFDRKFAGLDPELFFKTWLVDGLHAKAVVVGYDFRFGKNGLGDYKLLQHLGAAGEMVIERIPPLKENGAVISSSKIRQLLIEGNVELANVMLGYSFVIEGEVVTGEQRGRKLGFPTANIRLEPEFLLPCFGVYLVKLLTGSRSYCGLANVGIKPTFGTVSPLVEVYLFDVEVDLYHQIARVEFLKFIRPENRFSGPEALKAQIAVDVKTAKGYLGIDYETPLTY
jgi:riboflavin kinase / FMN adenylyltransferase